MSFRWNLNNNLVEELENLRMFFSKNFFGFVSQIGMGNQTMSQTGTSTKVYSGPSQYSCSLCLHDQFSNCVFKKQRYQHVITIFQFLIGQSLTFSASLRVACFKPSLKTCVATREPKSFTHGSLDAHLLWLNRNCFPVPKFMPPSGQIFKF